LVKIPNVLFSSDRANNEVECQFCGYKVIKPFPKDSLCPKCRKFLAKLYEMTTGKTDKTPPKQFETKTSTLSSKFKGKIKVKQKPIDISLDVDKIQLTKGEYIKLLGITSTDRTELFCSNENLKYLLELTNNLDLIATGVLGGELDKMLLYQKRRILKKNANFM
jgi:hypothetical protein